MPRARARRRAAVTRVPADPELFGLDLAAWAGTRVARGGRQDALLGRVEALQLSLDGRTIDARVRGNRPLPYRVAVEVGSSGTAAHCTCSLENPGPCRHAVAAVEALRFPVPARGGRRRPGRAAAGRGRIISHAAAVPGFVVIGGAERTRTREERVEAARLEELQLRRSRSRRERATVERIGGAGPLRFAVTPRGAGQCHVVALRGGTSERYGCGCADFMENELGTCSHVERVRSFRARRLKRDRAEIPQDLLSLWRSPRASIDRAPQALAELRVEIPGEQPPLPPGRYFEAEGWLRPPPADRRPADWVRAARAAARRLARRRGWVCDVDPSFELALDGIIAEERMAEKWRGAAADEPAWRRVLERVHLRLHPYQEDGARFLARTGRAFLADDMGLGKTAQAVVAALLLRETGLARRTLVVCPASLKHQWRQEIAKVCGERARVVEGPRDERLRSYEAWREGFLILNYELILRDLDPIRRAGADLTILDEAQRIKNWSTKTARAVKRLDSPHAFVLTGTPLENRLSELHSLTEFLHPRAIGPRWRLLPFHAVTDSQGRVVAYEGFDLLRAGLRGFFLRRERNAVQDQLPPRTDNTFWSGLAAAQLRPYRRHAAAAAAVLASPPPLTPPQARALLRALTSMRILCNAHAQYDWSEGSALLASGADADDAAALRRLHSPKIEEFARVLEDLLEQSDSKIVAFSQWERMLRLAHFAARTPLARRDLRAEVFHGGLASRERTRMLDAFRRDPEFRVLFSTDAGGLGLNLQEASIVVNLEVPWNPAVLEQRVGRVHRIGQRRSVQVLHFVTAGAIEERVRQAGENKRALFAGLLVDGADRVVLDGPSGADWIDRARILFDSPGPGDVEAVADR